MRLILTQRLAMLCTVCGGDLCEPEEAANDERLDEQMCLIAGSWFTPAVKSQCPKCGRWVMKCKLGGYDE